MALKYKKILYCTDFSEDANYAFLIALDMARKYRAQLYIFHVAHSPYKDIRQVVDDQVRKGEEASVSPEIIEKGMKELKERYEPKTGAFTNYEFHLTRGVPFVEIVRFALAQGVDCIVLGAVGISDLDRTTLGSTAENVARRAHCTVMPIRYPGKNFQLDPLGK